jgi:RNA polymerase sigma-70 factor (ECF subfamily)
MMMFIRMLRVNRIIRPVRRKNFGGWEMGSRCITTETKGEEALVRASQSGNDDAIETLFRRYQRQLLGTARRILGNTEDAEDALQDAFLLAYRNVARFEGRSKFSTWLTRIVVNAALMQRRRGKWLRLTSLDATPPESQDPISECLPDDDPNPEQMFAHTELREMIQTNVGQLSSPLLTAFVLCGIEEHTQEEAARQLGITVPAMKARMHRARYKLAKSLRPRLERRRTTCRSRFRLRADGKRI